MIVGAARSGTTSLYNYLEQHPEIFMPAMKEPHYFSGISPTIQSFDEYLSLFDGVEDETAVGEASSSYLMVPETAQKIYQAFGKIKIIILLRNPVKRAHSNWYLAQTHKKMETLSFREALMREDERYANRDSIRFWPGLMYFRAGLYSEQVKEYYDVFGKENVKVIIFEEFIAEPITYCEDIFKFLEVGTTFKPEIKSFNAAHEPKYQKAYDFLSTPPDFLLKLYNRFPVGLKNYLYNFLSRIHRSNRKPLDTKPEIDLDLYNNLLDRYLSDIHVLERILGRDLSIWYQNENK